MKKFKITDLSLFLIIIIALGVLCFLVFYVFNDKYVFYLKEEKIELAIGESYTVDVIAKNSSYSDVENYKFKVLDSEILTIDKNGVIVAQKTGTTTIIVTSKNGFLNTEELVVTVVKNDNIKIEKILFTDEVFYLKIGDKLDLTKNIIVEPIGADIYDLIWVSSNSEVVSVDKKGNVIAKGIGEVVVKASFNNLVDECKIIIQENDVLPDSINLSSQNVDMYIGEKKIINAIILPENSTNKEVKWESSDSSVARVENGQIFGVSVGYVVITATTTNGKSSSCNVNIKEILAESISLEYPNISLGIGDTQVVNYDIKPSNTTNKTLIWKSSDSTIASVSGGKITAKKAGKATITATTSNGKSASISVTVTENQVLASSVSFDKAAFSLKVGESYTLNATVSPGNTTNKALTWKSSDSTVVSVSGGKITAKKAGKATITATTSNGKSASISVTVTENQVLASSVSFDKTALSLKVGESYTLNATVSPGNTTNKALTWKSSDSTIASVSGGKITAKKAGKATITATTSNGKSASISVTVTNAIVNVTGINIENGTEGVVYLNTLDGTNSLKLNAIVYPSNANNKKITWSSSNTNVATVDVNGNVIIKNLGTAKINVVTDDGKYTDSFNVIAKKKVILVVTASLGVRMNDWFKTYTSANGNYYSIANKTLKYVYKSGSGFEFQYGEGLEKAKTFLNDNYANYKNYIDVYINFTMTGNSVKKLTCDGITTSDEYYDIAEKYNSSVQSIKNLGYYNIKGFVFSHSPLNTKHPLASNNNIVYSHSKYACSSGYRSAWKYYLSNKRMNSILSTGTYSNISFLDNFSSFVIIKSEADRTFTWIRPFSTPEDDALHWDEATTKLYMQVAFDNAGM